MATKKAAAEASEVTPEAIAAAEETSAASVLLCDYCHVPMRVVRQMMLNEQPHEVRQCSSNSDHVKTLPVE